MARFVSKTAFLEMLGGANFRSILAASKQSIDIEMWVFRFQSTADSPGIDLDYEDAEMSTRGGLEILEQMGIIETGTVARMYPVASKVTIKITAPFNEIFPDTYQATVENETYTIESGVQFAKDFVEVI